MTNFGSHELNKWCDFFLVIFIFAATEMKKEVAEQVKDLSKNMGVSYNNAKNVEFLYILMIEEGLIFLNFLCCRLPRTSETENSSCCDLMTAIV